MSRYLPMSKKRGVTLVELLISMALITVGIAGLVQSFGFIQKAVQTSKNRTLASNLAQEKMQILKQKVYYQVLVTTDPKTNNTDFTPDALTYDQGYFPPEEIVEAGVTYTRYTYIQSVREDSGVLADLAPNLPDTGMKRITISVAWGQGSGKRKVSLRSLLSNPDTVMSNVAFTGTVITTNAVPLSGALVGLVEAPGCADTTNSTGKYYINSSPATYTLMVSATGYYTSLRTVTIAAGNTQTNNFTLSAIARGSVEGYPWLIDHLLVSQVVGSTINASGYDQEYVEIFNPTNSDVTIDGQVGLKFQRADDASAKSIQITYLNSEIPADGYYLFANTNTVTVAGASVNADAVWSTSNQVSNFPYFSAQNNIIPVDEDGGGEGGGGVALYSLSDGSILDKVGWNKTGHAAPLYEGAAISQTVGLSRNELYARRSSTADVGGVNWGYGPAYDANINNVDFYDYTSPVSTAPHNSGSAPKTVISGTPAIGAVVSCSDGFSSSTEAISLGSMPYAYFSLVDIATGSWTVLITSGVYTLEKTTVTIASATSYTFPSSTTFITQPNDRGIISGRVLNVGGVPLNGIVMTSGGATSTNTGTDGRYRLRVYSGVINLTANPTVGGTSAYVTASSDTIPVEIGQVHSGVDFVLYQGGKIRGFVTRDGINGLPGVSVTILDGNGVAWDQQVSGPDGRFMSKVLPVGYYIAQPALGLLESSNPVMSTVTVPVSGVTQVTSTFTIFNAMGHVSGTVKLAGEPIKTGVLIVVTTTTLAGTPPAPPNISSATLTGAPLYMGSSMENGTYLVDVRSSTNPTYNVYAYYPTPSGATTVIVSSKTANVSVVAGQTTSGVNFSW